MGVGLPPIYAIIISLAIYFGIRIFVGRRKKMIEESVGERIKNVRYVTEKNSEMYDFYVQFIPIHA